MADKRLPEGAFLPDGQPNIPSQAYADYLKEINPMMVPVADPEGYVAPPRDTSEKPFSNYAFDKAFDTATGAGRSFKNAFTGQGVAQLMPKMQFYPGGPTGAEKIYGGAADVGLGVLSTALAGLEAGAGFIAERIPFQNENKEDRLSRDLLGGIEFLEQYTAPYLGLFSKIGRASKAATTANRAPEPPVAVAPEPEITIAPTLSGGTSLTDAITAAQAAERANRLQVDDILFSPSLKAAMELKQKKGPYEQLKATMIKTGAKPDELEWSGADDFFSGKNVTKEEIIDYLEQNDPRLVPNVRRAEGVLGSEAEAMDGREAVDQLMEDEPFVSEAMNNYLDTFADEILKSNNYTYTQSLDDDLLEEVASKLDINVDDLIDKTWVYVGEGDNVEAFDYSDEALAHMYGGRDKLNEALKINIRLMYEAEFDNDPPSFMRQYDIENPNAMDEVDTQYSEYFPEGGTDYTESLFQYTDPTGRIKIDTLAGSRHFGEDDAGTIFHTRHADYVNEDGDTVRYVGEIQSDPQQNIGNNPSNTYKQSLQAEQYSKLADDISAIRKQSVDDQQKIFQSQTNEFELSRLMSEASIFRLNQSLENPNSYNSRRASELGVEGKIPLSGEMTDAQEELLNEYIGEGGNPFRGRNWTGDRNAQDNVYDYLVDNEVDWLPEGVKKNILDVVTESRAKEDDIMDIFEASGGKPSRGSSPGGPLMSSQNKWVDEGLRRSIYDAVKDPEVDYLTFPNDPEAIAKVGGRSEAKEGTINYYQRDVQNRLKKLLKSFSKDVSVDEVNIQSEGFGTFSSKGFKITPEFRKAVMEKGIPTYAVPIAVGMGYGALDELGEK
tara:strand:+ start:4300 stop:6804 length:2505 start_codon:yes stop_codon:yes gene_type:complete